MRYLMFGFLFTLLLVPLAMADRATYDPTKTQIALPLPTPPDIDGIIDTAAGESWLYAGGSIGNGDSYWQIVFDENALDFVRGGVSGDGTTADNAPFSNEDLSFRIFVGYDANNLYVAVRVADDFLEEDSAAANSANGNTWEDDSVEIFVDGDNSNFETRDTTGTNPDVVGTGGQYVITVNNAYREAEAGNPGYGANSAWYAQTSLTNTGYEAEFRISLATIGNPRPGDIIGFTVSVNDDDDGGPNNRQVIWIGAPHTEVSYGNLLIGGRSYTAPKKTTPPTVDGTINASEYSGAQEIQLDKYNGVYDIPSGDDDWEIDDLRYSAWVVHDTGAIYVGVNVIDNVVVTDTAAAGSEDQSTWEDDSAEIFFDPDDSNDFGRGAGLFEGQYVFTPGGAWRDNEANNPLFGANDDWIAATSRTSTGYQIEFKVTKGALIDPIDGATMGFNVAANDDDEGSRKAQLAWSGRAHSEFSYGNLTLAGAGGTDVGEWSLY